MPEIRELAETGKPNILREEEYLAAMNGECRAWREACVEEGDLKSFDNTTLHYYFAVPADAKACIVMLHGFCEFFARYHEMAWYFYRAGYAFFFPEQRGHGLSGGKLAEPDVVWVDDFETYVRDLDVFINEIVLKKAPSLKRILFAHSMGGAVGTLYLESHPDVFAGAVFSSPMFRLKKVNFSPPALAFVKLYVRLTHREKTIAAGERHFTRAQEFEGGSMLSKSHYDYQHAVKLDNAAYQTYASSYGWAIAAIEATRRLIRDASRVRTKMVLLTAGNDALVDPGGYEAFMKRVPGTVRKTYPASKHEVYNADDATRMRFFDDLFGAIDSFLGVSD
ncbi:MAG: alpha/beta fold hydrolase [Lachnospiraceae bacterium]|nr:alpha/beta fold hydrolase [Lachnospiraceae bacterium]